jgi:hypothetical protein
MEFVHRNPQEGEAVMDYALLGGEHLVRGRRLFVTGSAVLCVLLVYLSYKANVDNGLHLVLGLVMFALSALPSLLWAKSGGSRFPVFETIMVLCANAYALPVLNANEQLASYSDHVITRACFTVILYQVSAIVTYTKVTGLPGRGAFWRISLLSHKVEQLIVYGLIGSTIYIWMSTFTRWIPGEYESILRAVFFGVGILCTFVSTQRWGRGELNQQEKAVLVCALTLQLVFMSISLVLISAISFIGIGLLGYISGGKRVPWIPLAGIFVILAVLHTGKTQMRTKYWDGGIPPPTLTELPAFYTEWVETGLQPTSGDKTVSQKMLERTSLMHILCLIIDWTPDRQDYLYGKTYGYVLPQLVPRVIWPDKPPSHVATFELAVYYGLQSVESTQNTTIAFGLLAEAYANFGLIGAMLLGFTWGFCLKKLQILSNFSPMFSFAGLLMILLTAWSFNSEMTLAVWLSSLEQAVIVLIGIPMVLRSMFGL